MRRQNIGSRRRRPVARRAGSSRGPSEGGAHHAYWGDVPDATRRRAVSLDDFWDAFEPDLFGGPEAEPQPEHGDFCYEPDDFEGTWG